MTTTNGIMDDEKTSLLPQRQSSSYKNHSNMIGGDVPRKDKVNDKWRLRFCQIKSNRNFSTLLIFMVVVVVVVVMISRMDETLFRWRTNSITTDSTITINEEETTTENRKELRRNSDTIRTISAPSQHDIAKEQSLNMDIRIDFWDQWKSMVNWSTAPANRGWFRNTTATRNTIQITYPINIQQSWSNDVDARTFGQYVQSWWSDVEQRDDATDVGALQKNKQGILEDNFQNWYSSASIDERSWWDTTIQTLARDKSLMMESVAKIANRSREEIPRDASIAVEKAKLWGGATKQWIQQKWNTTSDEIVRDAGITSQVGQNWFNHATDEIQKDKELTAEKTKEWWNDTKSVVDRDEGQATEKAGKAWEAAMRAAEKGKNSVQNKAKVAEDTLQKQAVQDESIAATKSKELWGKMESEASKDKKVADDALSSWWKTAKSATQSGWNGTVTAKEEWWNATQEWFSGKLSKHLFESSYFPLLYLNSTKSYALLMNGYSWYDYSSDFFLLLSGLDAQINQAYCGVASSAAILNTLRGNVTLPIDTTYDPYQYATQKGILENDCVRRNVVFVNDTFDGILHAPGGLNLQQTKSLLQCNLPHQWNVTAVHVDPEALSEDHVRQELARAVMNHTMRIIVNFDRTAIGQMGGGHFSPLGSYSKKEDAFLIMDVAKYKYPPVWVPLPRLYDAMATTDNCAEWDFPTAQESVDRSLTNPHSVREYKEMMEQVGCKVGYRGYILVEAPPSND